MQKSEEPIKTIEKVYVLVFISVFKYFGFGVLIVSVLVFSFFHGFYQFLVVMVIITSSTTG